MILKIVVLKRENLIIKINNDNLLHLYAAQLPLQSCVTSEWNGTEFKAYHDLVVHAVSQEPYLPL